MSALVGERDTLIMNTVPRHAAPVDRALMLSASATVFEVSASGAPAPDAITFSALMLGAVGEIAFSSEPPMVLSVANGNAVLRFDDMSASIVTVTATTVIDGLTYYSRQTVAKQQTLDLTPPPAPTGLAARGTPTTIVLHWDGLPANYHNLSHTEVWRAQINDFAQAALAGRADGLEYTDAVGPGAFRYYWIRHVSRAAIPGPYNAGSGTLGVSDAEVGHLLEVLTGEITQSQLHADLGQKIELIDTLETTYGHTANAATSAAAATAAAAAALLAQQQADSAAGRGGEYAAQSLQSATAAGTAASHARTYRDESSQAANSANASAAAAQSSQGVAAQAALGAANSAGAAAASSQDAASHANDAGVSSAASMAAKISAEAARNQVNSLANAAFESAATASSRADAAGTHAAAANKSALTASTDAARAGTFAGEAARSEMLADGSAMAAADFFQQAQAVLNDPVTGLINGVAAVKVAGEATASSVAGLKAKYSIRMEAGDVVGGLELLGGGGAINFAVRATSFSIAAPAGIGIAPAVPFIVRPAESVVNGVTVPAGTYMHNGFIENASITNAKIGGDIWSGNYAAGQSGWYLSRAGNLEVNQLRARGDIAGGSFTEYGWPGNGGTGFYLGPSGLLLGNYHTGKYIEIGSNGNIYAPGFRIIEGQAEFSGVLKAAYGTFSGSLSAASGTLGTITAGYLRNASNSAYVNLDATGSQPFLYAGGGRVVIGADGSGVFTRNEPDVIKHGTLVLSQRRLDINTPLQVYIDTEVSYPDRWSEAPSATYLGNAAFAYGKSDRGGCSGYLETVVVVGSGLYIGDMSPASQRIYLRVTWTPGSGQGYFVPEAITWKLIKV